MTEQLKDNGIRERDDQEKERRSRQNTEDRNWEDWRVRQSSDPLHDPDASHAPRSLSNRIRVIKSFRLPRH